ncbi:UNKNOWN [Stylonychia lemnae]|uniref:Uncharacterized protein n=1 Tax=Stylonychia lemnae TaxID=5949 RepID=A0A078A8E5_STYLE|nr:UNKNOWN [Stylonychia lemnae]|eukprot:CDW78141.1 UNKNOWN [Stylonychia lemnae]
MIIKFSRTKIFTLSKFLSPSQLISQRQYSTIERGSKRIIQKQPEQQEDEKPKEKPRGIKDAAFNQEFYGVPLKKMQPKDHQDLMFKLNQGFTTVKDLLNFFEANRNIFENQSYEIIFQKLAKYSRNKNKEQFKIAESPQYKVLLDDYSRHLGRELDKNMKIKKHTDTFNSFIKILDNVIPISTQTRFNLSLPTNIKRAFHLILEDNQYLAALSPHNISKLIYYNANPKLFDLTIKKITKNAHHLCDTLLNIPDGLSQLQPRDIYNILSGFGPLHLVPHSETLYYLEPWIISKLQEFSPDQLNLIAAYYIRLQRGNQLFLKQIISYVSMYQEETTIYSQTQLLSMFNPKYLQRKEFSLDVHDEVKVIAKAIIKNINLIVPKVHMNQIIPRFLQFQIGTKAYYEMLAIKFNRDIEEFNFKNKTQMVFWFALADIDQSYIYKTVHKLCASYSEAFIQKEQDYEPAQLGFFTEKQLKYIADAKSDLDDYESSIQNIEALNKELGKEEQLIEMRDKFQHDQIECITKLMWSFMVFQSSQDTDTKQDSQILWKKLIDILNNKLKYFKKESKTLMKSFTLDLIHQMNAYFVIELKKYGMKSAIVVPSALKSQDPDYFITSVNKEEQYKQFIWQVGKFLEEQGLKFNSFFENYRIYGGKNLSKESKKYERLYILLNQKNWYFDDTQTHNSFYLEFSKSLLQSEQKLDTEKINMSLMEESKSGLTPETEEIKKEDTVQQSDSKQVLFSLEKQVPQENSQNVRPEFQSNTCILELYLPISLAIFDQCERCRESLAAVYCLACGSDDPIKYCYDCDNTVHQISYKAQHKRNVIQFNQVQDENDSIENSYSKLSLHQPLRSDNNFNHNNNSISDLNQPLSENKSLYNFASVNSNNQTQETIIKKSGSKSLFQNEAFRKLMRKDSIESIGKDTVISHQTSQLNAHYLNANEEQNEYRSIENYYSKEYVEEIQQFYKKEKEEMRMKIMRLETMIDQERENFKFTVNELKLQHDAELRKHQMSQKQCQVQDRTSEQLREKDHQIQSLVIEINDLKSQINRITIGNKTMEKEMKENSSLNSQQLIQFQQQIEHYQVLIDKQKVEHQHQIRLVSDKLEQDKQNLKRDYENLINTIKTEYQQQKNEVREQLRRVELDLEHKKQDYIDLKQEFEQRIENLCKEMDRLTKQLENDQKGHSTVLAERIKVEQINKEIDKENRILNNEIQHLEDEVQRTKQENIDLKKKVKKMEKMVYGHSNHNMSSSNNNQSMGSRKKSFIA